MNLPRWLVVNKVMWRGLQRMGNREMVPEMNTLGYPLGSKKIRPINPKGNQSWILIERTDVETEAPILWPLDAKNWLIGKDPNAGKDWGQEEKGKTEDEMTGWYHWLNRHEFDQTLGDSERQGSMAYCSPWGHKGSDMTEWLSNNNIGYLIQCSPFNGAPNYVSCVLLEICKQIKVYQIKCIIWIELLFQWYSCNTTTVFILYPSTVFFESSLIFMLIYLFGCARS